MTNEEELKLKREENEKLDAEGDRLFFVRLGRVAVIVSFLVPFVVLPGFAAWRAVEEYYQTTGAKPFFWVNYLWLLLRDLYAVGAFGILFVLIYIVGGTRGLKLCWIWSRASGEDSKPSPDFWAIPLIAAIVTFVPYAFFVGVGIGSHAFYYLLIK
jgi:hypothetical protein